MIYLQGRIIVKDYQGKIRDDLDENEMTRIEYSCRTYGNSIDLAELLEIDEDKQDEFSELLKSVILNAVTERELQRDTNKMSLELAFNRLPKRTKKKMLKRVTEKIKKSGTL